MNRVEESYRLEVDRITHNREKVEKLCLSEVIAGKWGSIR